MAYVVSRPAGRWEIRESRSTLAGPRSRTLATFRVLTPEIVDLAVSRSAAQIDRDSLIGSARRAGATISVSPVEDCARQLIAELAQGRRLSTRTRGLLCAALHPTGTTSDTSQAALAWLARSPAERGAALVDLLLLADRLPARRREAALEFPLLSSVAR
jgi:hypothetical protein